ncbi:hypothetical protein MOQ_002647, partial [Trypanosoma cruzi marinkellei]
MHTHTISIQICTFLCRGCMLCFCGFIFSMSFPPVCGIIGRGIKGEWTVGRSFLVRKDGRGKGREGGGISETEVRGTQSMPTKKKKNKVNLCYLILNIYFFVQNNNKITTTNKNKTKREDADVSNSLHFFLKWGVVYMHVYIYIYIYITMTT